MYAEYTAMITVALFALLGFLNLAVKDIFDLRGPRTSLGSHPYYQLYPPRQQTAKAVSRLIPVGADVVGKIVMSAFALTEHPMQRDWEKKYYLINIKKLFRTWFLQRYMSLTENVLFFLPIAKVTLKYRDIYPGIPTAPSAGLSVTSLSPSTGAPELTMPVSEIPFFSPITRKTEKLPVLAGLMGMPGADLEIVQVARHILERLGLRTRFMLEGISLTAPSG